MHLRQRLAAHGICHRLPLVLQRAICTSPLPTYSLNLTSFRHRKELLKASNQHAPRRSLSFPKPPPIDLTKVEGPKSFVDVDLPERPTKISFVGEDTCDKRIYIKKMNSVGFRLSNGLFAVGPIAIFPRFVLQWRVGRVDKIPPGAFAPFFLVEPKVDYLIMGYGDPEERIPTELRQALMQRRRFGFDFMPTEKAIGLYNFMVEEGRYCAGLFIPPVKITLSEDDHFQEGERLMELARPYDDFTQQNHVV